MTENFGWGATWLERLDANPMPPALWLRHPARDTFWKHGSVCEDYSAITAATHAIDGWNDF